MAKVKSQVNEKAASKVKSKAITKAGRSVSVSSMADGKKAERKKAERKKAKSKNPSSKNKKSSKLEDMRSVERHVLPKALLSILDEHRYVVRLLKILEAEADELVGARTPELESILSIMHYIGKQTDNFHHPKEDLIFERLAKSNDDIVETVEELASQHKELRKRRRSVILFLDRLKEKNTRKLAQTACIAIHEYSQMLLAHMLLEEKEVFAVAYRDFGAADWRAIDRKIAPVIDPIFGSVKSSRYMDLFDRYVNHTVSISKGIIPVGLVEMGASRIEKYTAKSAQLARKFWMLDACSLRKEKQDDQYGSVFTVDEASLADAKKGEGNTLYEGAARISWQASATNLFLRATLKPYLSRVSLDGVSRLVKTPNMAFSVPPSLNTAKVKSKNFEANWVKNKSKPRTKRTILYLPGGGFVFPASSFHYHALSELANRVDARGMLVHYRLAPEHPFPAGLEDAVAAYRYLIEECEVPPNEIVIAGDSAGGGLSLSLLLSIREMNLPMPLCACVFSPFTDVSFSSASVKYNRWLDPMLPAVERAGSFDVYCGEHAADNPLVSPVHGSFEGLPPILAQVSSTETLLDDTLRVARNARAQDAKFEVEVWQGLPHVFQIMSFMPESRHALKNVAAFISKQLPRASKPEKASQSDKAKTKKMSNRKAA